MIEFALLSITLFIPALVVQTTEKIQAWREKKSHTMARRIRNAAIEKHCA